MLQENLIDGPVGNNNLEPNENNDPLSSFKSEAITFKCEIEQTAKIIVQKHYDLRDKKKHL